MCRNTANEFGWYIQQYEDNSYMQSVLPGECTGANINYYAKIQQLLDTKLSLCKFDGEEFDSL